MNRLKGISKFTGLAIVAAWCLMAPSIGCADAFHTVTLPVPPYAEEATTWCGPATAQMVLGGYPGITCEPRMQEDIWEKIRENSAEPLLWDTDPEGMKSALFKLCRPSGGWVIDNRIDPEKLMFQVAYWMTINRYPVAIVKSASSSSHGSHGEHWVAIMGIGVNADPTTASSVTLEHVWFIDPSPKTPGNRAIVSFVSGTQWYEEFEPVAKVGSAYHGKYVAVIEPPKIKGVALPREKVMTGAVIRPGKALAFAQRWVEEKKLTEIESYKALAEAKALEPLLVNESYGGYYLVPYSTDGVHAQAAVIVNAYTGDFEEVGAFDSSRYMPLEQAKAIAMEKVMLGPQPEPPDISGQLVHPRGEKVVSRCFPMWKMTIGRQTLGITQDKKVYMHMPRLQPSISVPAVQPRTLAWDQKNVWLVDREKKELKRIDSRSGAAIQTHKLDIEDVGALTFDGRSLWVADPGAMKIFAVNPENGERMKTLPLRYPKEKGFQSVTGMAWDGESIWMAVAAGFSSSINQIDPDSGEIRRSIFAECEPRGIDIVDNTLFTICYNGKNLPAKIDRRRILDKNHQIQGSREFIMDLEVTDPGALVHDGRHFRVLDRETNQIVEFPLKPSKK